MQNHCAAFKKGFRENHHKKRIRGACWPTPTNVFNTWWHRNDLSAGFLQLDWQKRQAKRTFRTNMTDGKRSAGMFLQFDTVDGRNPAPPKQPQNDDSPENTTNHGFPWFILSCGCVLVLLWICFVWLGFGFGLFALYVHTHSALHSACTPPCAGARTCSRMHTHRPRHRHTNLHRHPRRTRFVLFCSVTSHCVSCMMQCYMPLRLADVLCGRSPSSELRQACRCFWQLQAGSLEEETCTRARMVSSQPGPWILLKMGKLFLHVGRC